MKMAFDNNAQPQLDRMFQKPLPRTPLFSQVMVNSLDNEARSHIRKVLQTWLSELSLPLMLWENTLFSIGLSISENLLQKSSSPESSTNGLWVQFLSANSPKDSRFLLNVSHGESLQGNEHNVHIPLCGTIRIYGVKDVTTSSNLRHVLQSLAYLSYSLYLEAYIMRDSGVPTQDNEMWKEREASNDQKPVSFTEKPATSPDKAAGPVAITWLKKLTHIKHVNMKRQKDEHRKTDAFSKATIAVKRKLSLMSNNRHSTLSYNYSPTTLSRRSAEQNEAFRIANNTVLLSSSPSCYYPAPSILTRLEKQLISQLSKDIEAVFKKTIWFRPDSSYHSGPYQTVDLPGLLKNQSLTADLRKAINLLSTTSISLEGFQQQQSIAFNFSYHPIGCPERPCLGPFISKIDFFRYETPKSSSALFPSIDQSLGNTIKHWYNICQMNCQDHIEELIRLVPSLTQDLPNGAEGQKAMKDTESNGGKSDRSTPEQQSVSELPEYYTSNTSTPYISKTPTDKRLCCKVHGCSKPVVDHVFSFMHGKGRVNVYMTEKSSETMDNTNIDITDRIITWSTCHACETTTPPICLSLEAASFSFAKYLELIFYSNIFASSVAKLPCAHTLKEEMYRSVDRCFLYNGKVFRFVYEGIQSHTIILPRTQTTGESIPPEITSSGSTLPRLSYVTLNDWKYKIATEDVATLFDSIDDHLNLLYQYYIAESRRRAREILHDLSNAKKLYHETKSLDMEFKLLRRKLRTDHQAIIDRLDGTSVNDLNIFRIYYAVQARSIINYITVWQDEHCKEVADLFLWDGPDYIHSETIHCFPGSSILVRQEEPSSIIAYTLSSNDYIQELLLDQTFTNQQDRNRTQSTSLTEPTNPLEEDNISNKKPMLQEQNDKQYNADKPLPSLPPAVIDGYYSSIERKFISPGSATETASFRTMLTEIVRTSVPGVSFSSRQRLEELKARISPWSKQHEEKLGSATTANSINRQLVENTLEPLTMMQQQQHETKEISLISVYRGETFSDNPTQNVGPHIKHKFVHNNIEFTCIVYYAKEFDSLRKTYGIDRIMIESLSRCQTWTTSGGKSKSNFYKTQDDRFVIKELVNAWNISEKDAFLKFAPKYFSHLRTSTKEPSVLAKIFGFFTIRMKTVEDKKSIFNMDLLVMEHLFSERNIIRRFDFKGLQNRKVDEQKNKDDITLWDKDWLDEYRMRLLTTENSKAVMEIAIANDTEFLSRCNAMDYSLLVGIDKITSEISVGIVDYIGAYTWYKKVESKSKSTLQRHKEVTVLPPEQYRERFVREICDYFVSIPDKFDTIQQSKILPSLLI